MILKYVRENFTNVSTIGRLSIDGTFECYICEDVNRHLTSDMSLSEISKIKIKKSTCIPYGTYRIHITFSNRFQKMMPLLEGVPGFEGIRIHPGNTAEDTEGCLLTGTSRALNYVSGSRNAFKKLYTKIEKALANNENVTIIVTK